MPKSGSKSKHGESKKLSSGTMQKLVEFFSRQAEIKRKLQIIKEMLAEESDFTPASLFHRLDTTRNGFLTQKDLSSFMRDQNLSFKGSQIKILFGKINTNKQINCIQLRQFQNFILPNQNPRLRYITMRRPVLIPLPGQPLSQKIEWIVARLFSETMDQYTKLGEIHNSLLSSFDFDAQKIFSIISRDGNSISAQDLQAFFQTNNKQITIQELGCLIRHMDRRGEGLIQIEDFKFSLATLGLRKQHEIFDQLSPIPALKQSQNQRGQKGRGKNLKGRYEDNLSYEPIKAKEEKTLGYVKGKSGSKLSISRRNQ